MQRRIEDYALIGDCQTAALVACDGSMDWLCVPRFDSGACFAALLGDEHNGRWRIAPIGDIKATRRSYRGDTLVLETDFETESGTVTLVDCMPIRQDHPFIVRSVVGRSGLVPMRMDLTFRFDYGSLIPWVQRMDGGIRAVAGANAMVLSTPVPLRGENLTTVAEFNVREGERVPFVLAWYPSHVSPPELPDPDQTIEDTISWWSEWSARCTYRGPWRDTVMRSLITLRSLLYDPTGGMVAAPTTSLPEHLGGVRNWDYRFCWLRDATFTLLALLLGGYEAEAAAWRNWLLRAVAGSPEKLQILYSVTGERRLDETTLDWLAGYADSRPVRVGNAASQQFQLDVYGEVLDLLYQSRRHGVDGEQESWPVERAILDFLETAWHRPDDSLWEVRGPQRHFTHSKMMAWVAFDRAVKNVEDLGKEGPLERWRKIRDEIHAQVCDQGYSRKLNAFTQSYGEDELDAALLLMPIVGFLPANDPRVRGTVAAVQTHLMKDGFVMRYNTRSKVDGLPAGEGAFLPCTCWLADNLALDGRRDEAIQLFERLLAVRNDLGLVSEEYDPHEKRLVGNFPQAFSHVGLLNTATNIAGQKSATHHRCS